MISEKWRSHWLDGKSFGCVFLDQRPSKVTSYFALIKTKLVNELTYNLHCVTRLWYPRNEEATDWMGSPLDASSWTRDPQRSPRILPLRKRNRAHSAHLVGCAQQPSAHRAWWTNGCCPWPKPLWNQEKRKNLENVLNNRKKINDWNWVKMYTIRTQLFLVCKLTTWDIVPLKWGTWILFRIWHILVYIMCKL